MKSYLIPNRNKYITWDIYNWSRAFSYIDSQKSTTFLGKNVLEIGANNGELSLWAAEKGANVICSDINEPSIDAIKKADHYKLKNIRFYGTILYCLLLGIHGNREPKIMIFRNYLT